MYITFIFVTTVINQPNATTVCKEEGAMFTCVLNTTGFNITNDVLWISSTMGTVNRSTNINFTTTSNSNNLTNTTLTITRAVKSYTGYYWVRLSSKDDVCNVSLTVGESM